MITRDLRGMTAMRRRNNGCCLYLLITNSTRIVNVANLGLRHIVRTHITCLQGAEISVLVDT